MKNILKNHIAELHNITWPTQKQAVHAMITVLVVMAITGFFLGFLDNLFSQAFSALL